MIRGLDFHSHPLDLQEVERGWRLNHLPMNLINHDTSLINHDIMKPLQNQKDRVGITSRLMNTWRFGGSGML